VTGTLGGSGAGLALLRQGKRPRSSQAAKDADRLIARHQSPQARVEAGVAIARWCRDAAMIDLSDGLAADLPRLSRASGCGFDVRLAVLPIPAPLLRQAERLPHSPLHYALFGGEDYELLFTTSLPPEKWRARVARAAPGRPLRVTRIGAVRAGEGAGVRFLDREGREVALEGGSFQHFE